MCLVLIFQPFLCVLHASSIMLIESKRFGSGYKPEPAR